MTLCEHLPYNWDLVYQCRGCGDLVPEEMAQKLFEGDGGGIGRIAELETRLKRIGILASYIRVSEEGLRLNAIRELAKSNPPSNHSHKPLQSS